MRTAALLTGLFVLVVGPAAIASDKPTVLVTGWQITGTHLKSDPDLPRSMEVVTEAVLADRYQTVSGKDVNDLKMRVDWWPGELHESASLRLRVAETLGADGCVTGWACSFGESVVLVVETIDVRKGLPGRVRRIPAWWIDSAPIR